VSYLKRVRTLFLSQMTWKVILSDACKFNYIHIPCNRLIIRYLIQLFAQSVINSYLSRSFYMFLRLHGHYHGGIYKGRQIQQFLSKMGKSLTEIALIVCLCIFPPDDDILEVETYRRNKSDMIIYY
jgi:hypothetical protein